MRSLRIDCNTIKWSCAESILRENPILDGCGTSVAADHSNPGQTNYAASKGAINSFTRALAVELAGRGVTVNAIAPGFIETDMSENVRNKAGDLIKKIIPLKRLGQPDDIAKAAVFLASADAAYITGQVLTVDGGLSLGAVTI